MVPDLSGGNPGELKSEKFPYLRLVIICSQDEERYPGTYDFNQLLEMERDYPADEVLSRMLTSVGPDDPYCIIYTSGTTGERKGVVITHDMYLRKCGNLLL